MIAPARRTLIALAMPVLLAGPALAQKPAAGATSAEIDAQVWKVVAETVVNDDIVTMAKTYHPSAVLVTNAGTKLITAALDGWGKDMVVAKKNGVHATVELRFGKRQDDATTAFESGAFKYTTTDKAGKVTSRYTRMEALLIKTNGRWQTLMEHQMDPITEAEWNRLPH